MHLRLNFDREKEIEDNLGSRQIKEGDEKKKSRKSVCPSG